MNKNKFIGILMILIFIGSFITVSAAPFSIGFYNIQDFFRGSWSGNDEILLFTLLFVLFTAAFTLALGKAFGETNRQIKVMAVVIALISSLSIVATTTFSLDQVAYIALGLGFLLLVLLIQGILLKMGVKNKFVAFILSLLIALFLTFILAKLLSERPSIGRFDFFDLNLGKFKKSLDKKFSQLKFPPVKDWFKGEEKPAAGDGKGDEEVTPPTTTTTVPGPPEEKPREWPNPLWLLLLLIPLLYLGYRKREDIKKLIKREEKEPVLTEIKNTNKKLYSLLKTLIGLQEKIMKHFNDKIKKGIIYEKDETEGYDFPKNDPLDVAWLYDEKNQRNTKKILKEVKGIIHLDKKLIKEIEKGLDLSKKEYNIIRFLFSKLKEDREYFKSIEDLLAGKRDEHIQHEIDEAKIKGYPPLDVRHWLGLKAHPEFEKNVEAEVIIDQKEMEFFAKELAPVIIRLYQLFSEFKSGLEEEKNRELKDLKEHLNTMILEGKTGKLKDTDLSNLRRLTAEFVKQVKDKEWVIYKNLEKEHDDKMEVYKKFKDIRKGVEKAEKGIEELIEEEEKEVKGEKKPPAGEVKEAGVLIPVNAEGNPICLDPFIGKAFITIGNGENFDINLPGNPSKTVQAEIFANLKEGNIFHELLSNQLNEELPNLKDQLVYFIVKKDENTIIQVKNIDIEGTGMLHATKGTFVPLRIGNYEFQYTIGGYKKLGRVTLKVVS